MGQGWWSELDKVKPLDLKKSYRATFDVKESFKGKGILKSNANKFVSNRTFCRIAFGMILHFN